uniref:Benzoyl-CoA reductase subunit BadG n=1 Tax=Loigolactobacillus rennini TaxID=238013 RepID=A0A1K2I3Q9_9LACO|nr:Benzoyl-CoA reductase subunit BadG [Loigolactobacillus rennini]
MYYIGLDAGSTTTKAVLCTEDKIVAKYLLPTAGDPKGAMHTVLDHFTKQYGPYDYLITTGYGRKLLPADLVITEITCHGRGAEYLHPGITQVIDIGGQDCKTIQLNGKGGVLDFNMNDRCAAGTGRFVEVMMKTLGEDIDILDDFVADATPVKINSMCTVFAESEVVSLVAKGTPRENIALGVLNSIAKRIKGQYIKLQPKHGSPILFTGGLSRSKAFAKVLKSIVDAPIYRDDLGQYAGAIGAAQIGLKKLQPKVTPTTANQR